MAILNARSPKFVSIDNANMSYAVLKLYIWSGAKTSPPTEFIYEINKSPLTNSTKVSFEIAELVRDELDTIFDGNYYGQAVWSKADIVAYNSTNTSIETSTETFTSFDGYEYFEYPTSPEVPLMITNRELFVLDGSKFSIPIYTGVAPTVILFKNGVVVSTYVYTVEPESIDQIEYIEFEDIDKIEVYVNSILVDTVNIKSLNECLYIPKKITFINKFGVLQDMYFFKKSTEKIAVKRESYKANIINQNNTYSTYEHVNRDFNITAQESTTLSSGFLNEEYNEVFKQMMLSEKIWVTNILDAPVWDKDFNLWDLNQNTWNYQNEQILPINVKTSNIEYKTSLNDRLVEYTFDFDNSFNVINNIR